jgi:hypothetical protein
LYLFIFETQTGQQNRAQLLCNAVRDTKLKNMSGMLILRYGIRWSCSALTPQMNVINTWLRDNRHQATVTPSQQKQLTRGHRRQPHYAITG